MFSGIGKTQINFSGTAHSEGQELIATLLGFMGPIIQMYVPSLGELLCNISPDCALVSSNVIHAGEHAPEQTINVTNLGSKLITALEEFLAAVVKSRLHFRERANEIDGKESILTAVFLICLVTHMFTQG